MTLKSIFFPLASLVTSLSYIKEDLLKIVEWCCQKSQQDENSFVKKSSTTQTVNDHNKAFQVDLFSHRVRTGNKLCVLCVPNSVWSVSYKPETCDLINLLFKCMACCLFIISFTSFLFT